MLKKEASFITVVLDKSTILSIIMISLLVSLLTLSIPIAAQTLINLIAFGKLFQPVLTLSIIVLILMLALGVLDIWQTIIIEVIQQKLMVKISLNLTNHFTNVSLYKFSMHHRAELVNRFFEIVTVNKSLASLLLYGINLGLQIILGLLLLLFYHPLFLVFDAFILISIALIIIIPYRKGLESAKEECTQKHQIGAWLEEVVSNQFLFRFNNYYRYAIHQSDKRLVSFLIARNAHFKQLIKHQIGFYVLSALASSLLLSLGGYLVINNQLSLGQLVAAEIVLGALIYGFKRFSIILESYYDLLSSEYKLDSVLNLPVEEMKEDMAALITPIQQIKLAIVDKNEATASIKNPLLICTDDIEKSNQFTAFFLGFRNDKTMRVMINEMRCMEVHRRSIRQHTIFIRDPEWFSGTIYDNIRLNQDPFSTDRLKLLLHAFGLMDKILQQPQGLKSIVYEWETVFTQRELIQLMMIRALLAEPALLIIDRSLDKLADEDIILIMNALLALQKTILIVVSEYPDRIPISNHLVI